MHSKHSVARYATPALLAAALCAGPAFAQSTDESGRWTIGVQLGELPMQGSFKVGLSIGYQVEDRLWLGFSYQIADSISRDGSSFNARSTGLDGLLSSSERVGQRAYLQARIRPHEHAPYLSLGLMFNDRDVETIAFDDRPRELAGAPADGPLQVQIARKAAVRPAIGLGYAYRASDGLELFAEWSGWWLFGAPEPEVRVSGGPGFDPAGAFARGVQSRVADHFTASPFNSYHMFQIGLSWVR